MKRRAVAVTEGWDDKMNDVPLIMRMKEMITGVHQDDPLQGQWCVDGREVNVWVDASSFTTGVSLEHDGILIELRDGDKEEKMKKKQKQQKQHRRNWFRVLIYKDVFTDSIQVQIWISSSFNLSQCNYAFLCEILTYLTFPTSKQFFISIVIDCSYFKWPKQLRFKWQTQFIDVKYVIFLSTL